MDYLSEWEQSRIEKRIARRAKYEARVAKARARAQEKREMRKAVAMFAQKLPPSVAEQKYINLRKKRAAERQRVRYAQDRERILARCNELRSERQFIVKLKKAIVRDRQNRWLSRWLSRNMINNEQEC